jgi:hypothetical protein
MANEVNKLHGHVCSSCGEAIYCCGCGDKRQNDRTTGQERHLLCLRCCSAEEMLIAYFGKDAVLDKVS